MNNQESQIFVRMPPSMPKRRFMHMRYDEAHYWMVSFNRWARHANAREHADRPPPGWKNANWYRCTRPRNMLAFYCPVRGMGVMCFKRVKPAWLPPHGRRALVEPRELVWAGWVRKRPVKLRDGQVLYV